AFYVGRLRAPLKGPERRDRRVELELKFMSL
ncbi:MAG: hypothetical protein ACI8XO_002522, partial [Verrucomicrobiales bacterium]